VGAALGLVVVLVAGYVVLNRSDSGAGPARGDALSCRPGDPATPLERPDEVVDLRVDRATLCRFTNDSSIVAQIDPELTDETRLTPVQVADVQAAFDAARRAVPGCTLFDGAPPVSYLLLLQDGDRHRWSVEVPEDPCLGFVMAGRTYVAPELSALLQALTEGTVPADPVLGTPVDLPTSDWEPGDFSMQALITGVLEVDDGGCVFLRSQEGFGSFYAVWPHGYTATSTGGTVTLFDAAGRPVAVEGQAIRAGGGEVSRERVEVDTDCLPDTGAVTLIQSSVTVDDLGP
jgi:hypothetical protein